MTPAMHDPASEERARIVTWLRDPETTVAIMRQWDSRKRNGDLTTATMVNRGVAFVAITGAANAIERGDHLRPDPAERSPSP